MIAGVVLWGDLVVRSQATDGPTALHLAAVGIGEVMIVGIVFGTGAMILQPLIKSWTGQSNEGGRPIAPRDIEARLDRIEHAVEAIAEEVERISEGQRFVTQLMSNPEVRMLAQSSEATDTSRPGGPR
jgi:hypothetical protein